MKASTRALLPLIALILAASPCDAQEVNLARVEPGSGRIHTSFGLDPALVTTLGYARGFRLGKRTALWASTWEWPPPRPT